MTWVKGGVDKPSTGADRIPLSLPPKYAVSTIAQDTTLSDCLIKVDDLFARELHGS
jgi:hypothetical protein